MAFDAVVYTDLKEKTIMRISNILNEINIVKTSGYRRQGTKVVDLAGAAAEDSQALTHEVQTPHKKSTRLRQPKSLDNTNLAGNESNMQLNGGDVSRSLLTQFYFCTPMPCFLFLSVFLFL